MKIQPKNREELVDHIVEVIDSYPEGDDIDLNYIDVSRVKDFSNLFSYFGERPGQVVDVPYGPLGWSIENIDISKWDMSNAVDLSDMFNSTDFNGDISNWDVSNVKTMYGMFFNSKFNGDISKWDVSSVENMSDMFLRSKLFDKDLSNGDVSSVTLYSNFNKKSKLKNKNCPKFN